MSTNNSKPSHILCAGCSHHIGIIKIIGSDQVYCKKCVDRYINENLVLEVRNLDGKVEYKVR